MQGGYQQTPSTVVVVQQQRPWRNRGPQYLQQGIRCGGIVLSLPIIICLGFFGVIFVIGGINMIALDQDTDIFDDLDDDDDATTSVGAIMLVIGVLLLGGCIALASYAKKQYNNRQNSSSDNPGRIFNTNPSPIHQQQPFNVVQPGLVPTAAGHMTQYSPSHAGMPPTGGLMPQYPPAQSGMPPMGGHMPHYSQGQQGMPPMGGQMPQYSQGQQGMPPMGGQMPQYPPAHAGGYAPQPSGSYPSNDPSLGYPPPYGIPTGAVPQYPVSSGSETKTYPPPSAMAYSAPGFQGPPGNIPGMTGNPSQLGGSEYASPPPYAPDYKPLI